MTTDSTDAYRDLLVDLQERIVFRLHELQRSAEPGEMVHVERDGPADVVFTVDEVAEEVLDEFLPSRAAAEDLSFTLITEETGERTYGDDPDHWLMLDLVDGSREYSSDTRSAWTVGCVAPGQDRPTLADATVAAQAELPATKQWMGDRYVWTGGTTTRHRFVHSASGLQVRDAPEPPVLRDMAHRFWCWSRPFTGDAGPIPGIRTALEDRAGLDTVYPATYISTAGQLAHLATGRYGMATDLRPLAGADHHARPYDLASVAAIRALDVPVYTIIDGTLHEGVPVDFGIEEPVSWIGYASPHVRDTLHPDLVDILRDRDILTGEA